MAVTTDEILGNDPKKKGWAPVQGGQTEEGVITPGDKPGRETPGDKLTPEDKPGRETPGDKPEGADVDVSQDKSEEGVAEIANVSVDNASTADLGNPKTAGEVVKRGVVNVANPQSGKASSDTEEGKPQKSYLDLYLELNPYTPPTKEELEKERRKQRREKTFASIGDAISAMSNLYFTTQYAPNAYDGSKTLSGKARERFDKINRDHQDNFNNFMSGYLRAQKMDDDKANAEREWWHKIEREKVTDRWREAAEQRKAADDEYKARMHELNIAYREGKIDEQKLRKEEREILNDYMRKNGMKMPTQRVGSGSGSGGSGGNNDSYKWRIRTPDGGERFVYARSKDQAYSHLRDGEVIIGPVRQVEVTENKQNQYGEKQENKKKTTTKTVSTAGSKGSGYGGGGSKGKGYGK